MLGLIVNLKSNNCRMGGCMLRKLPDYPFSVMPVGGIQYIKKLSVPIGCLTLFCGNHNLRVLLHKPGGYRISRGADNHLYPCLLCLLKNLVNIGEIEDTFLPLQSTPGGLCNADYIHPGLFHHVKIFIYPAAGHILRVICRSKKQFIFLHNSSYISPVIITKRLLHKT